MCVACHVGTKLPQTAGLLRWEHPDPTKVCGGREAPGSDRSLVPGPDRGQAMRDAGGSTPGCAFVKRAVCVRFAEPSARSALLEAPTGRSFRVVTLARCVAGGLSYPLMTLADIDPHDALSYSLSCHFGCLMPSSGRQWIKPRSPPAHDGRFHQLPLVRRGVPCRTGVGTPPKHHFHTIPSNP